MPRREQGGPATEELVDESTLVLELEPDGGVGRGRDRDELIEAPLRADDATAVEQRVRGLPEDLGTG